MQPVDPKKPSPEYPIGHEHSKTPFNLLQRSLKKQGFEIKSHTAAFDVPRIKMINKIDLMYSAHSQHVKL